VTDNEGNFESGWNAMIFLGTLSHNVLRSKSFIRSTHFLVLGDTMRAFRVIGSFKISKRGWQDFNIEVAAEDESAVTQKVLSNFGSHHRVKRRNICIKEIAPLAPESVSNPIVKYLIGGT